jgi:hypothetical protein
MNIKTQGSLYGNLKSLFVRGQANSEKHEFESSPSKVNLERIRIRKVKVFTLLSFLNYSLVMKAKPKNQIEPLNRSAPKKTKL